VTTLKDGDLEHLRRLVLALEIALRSEDLASGKAPANELATITSRLINRVQRDPTIDPELGAALAVFRNAAFAFRRLSKSAKRNDLLAATCATLIVQGNDLLEVYVARTTGPADPH